MKQQERRKPGFLDYPSDKRSQRKLRFLFHLRSLSLARWLKMKPSFIDYLIVGILYIASAISKINSLLIKKKNE